MKFSLLALAAAAGLAAGQQTFSLPDCSHACVGSYITGNNISGCKTTDIACICANKEFLSGISCCLEHKCSKDDIDKTIRYAAQLCSASGTVIPTQLICGQAASSTSASAAASQTSTGTASSTSSATAPAATKSSAASPAAANLGNVLGAALALAAFL
ncbi:uncharacterized protein UV8b_02933 [Ustilaginoidea virens]|uniref:CFEM domain-containing protein n=1 Tax=Ustilaginoidea virens TaxID=1159556 RepID=A0A8E5MGB4_USTVR|nr:uncharacterized protein UV8b_02933 [Ustilaginoidea virens]QUC18692.1 hypothetical protein UV8b_02933 [Ustilaginoidea virens]